MKSKSFAGLAGFAAMAAHAQSLPPLPLQPSLDPLVVTATRGGAPATTLRDAIVITREDLDASGALSLGEVLQRRAGVDLRSNGGPGQPQGAFMRGASPAQTLVLVDGLRVGSSTVGSTAIEHLPLDLIERVEVVKGSLSSLYGGDAIGGVIQIFTRGKGAPYFFASAGAGMDREGRAAIGISTADENNKLSLSMGGRTVDAASATNPRAASVYNGDRDPYQNGFANLRASHRLWQGEVLELDAFTSYGRTHFDAGPASDERNDQSVSGVRFSSSSSFTPWWLSRLTVGEGRDRLEIRGASASRFETRQTQASWVNEFASEGGSFMAGMETLRERVQSDEGNPFSQSRRDTNSAFLGASDWRLGQRTEASYRWDRDPDFGQRGTGSISSSVDWSFARLALTYAEGFRVPTFYDLYGPSSDQYSPNPNLRPEKSRGYEVSLRGLPGQALQWRITAFDTRLEDLIAFDAAAGSPQNVARARIRGVEVSLEGRWLETAWKASFTAQRPRDDETGKQLQGRSERFGSLLASRSFGAWTGALGLTASGPRFDSAAENPATRLSSYAVVDARVRYNFDKRWSAELAATNLADRRYETAMGYDAPRRAVLLSVRFESY
jgi:vitamin B12 transporter